MRYEWGTACRASSETVKMTGHTAIASPMPRQERVQTVLGSEHALHPRGEHDERKEPMTTDGTPARSSMVGLMISASPFAGELGN